MTEQDLAYISLGSNQDDRLEHLKEALEKLSADDQISIVVKSAVFETQPVEVSEDQDLFLNMIAGVETDLEPRELLETLQKIEQQLGRKNKGKKAPRTIDLDIIFMGQTEIDEANLTIPHPRYQDRKFVLSPLSHIAPEFNPPNSKKNVTELLKECDDDTYIHIFERLI